jgi:hypothetical protein
MAQLFGRNANWMARSIFFGLPLLALLSISVAEGLDQSSYVTGQNEYLDQPVPFSHEHHVGDLGIDCRYCHTQVERGAIAQIPPSETCMTCHSQIWSKSPTLAPVRDSYRSGDALRWKRVTRLPDFVYFDHSVHVAKGVACVTCHGQMQKMKLTRLEHPMQMQFCIDCHRDPTPHLHPPEEVTNPRLVDLPPEIALELARKYDVKPKMDCITCHR